MGRPEETALRRGSGYQAFIELDILGIFVKFLEKCKKFKNFEDFEERVLFIFSYLLTNVKDSRIKNYIFISKEFHWILLFEYNFENYFVVSRFVGFVKSIALKFYEFPFQIFYNKVAGVSGIQVF